MIFSFLKYLQPTNYFILPKKNGDFIFPIVDETLKLNNPQIEEDLNYTSKIARNYDFSWQVIQSGYIGNKVAYKSYNDVPIEDEYRFLRKNFNKVWVIFVYILRIISFKNPIEETISFFKTKNVKRTTYLNQHKNYNSYLLFEGKLVKEEPLISVIIPTLNRYKYLEDVLKDLEKQTYKNFEVIIVDQTNPFKEDFYQGWNLNLNYWYQEEKALWKARNEAIKASKGEYVLLYDDDSLIDNDWIEQHIKGLDFFKADISSGVSISNIGAKVPENYSFFKVSDQLDTGNVLIKKEVFRKIGLFDRQFEKQRMGDGEFGLRSFLNNFKNISNPYAKRIHLKVSSGGLRQMGLWDAFSSNNFFGPKPVPSVLYFYRKYFGKYNTLLFLLKSLPKFILPYKFKNNRFFILLFLLLTVFMLPLTLFNILKSWKLSSRMLSKGEIISTL